MAKPKRRLSASGSPISSAADTRRRGAARDGHDDLRWLGFVIAPRAIREPEGPARMVFERVESHARGVDRTVSHSYYLRTWGAKSESAHDRAARRFADADTLFDGETSRRATPPLNNGRLRLVRNRSIAVSASSLGTLVVSLRRFLPRLRPPNSLARPFLAPLACYARRMRLPRRCDLPARPESDQ
jgi:hypothetical protein